VAQRTTAPSTKGGPDVARRTPASKGHTCMRPLHVPHGQPPPPGNGIGRWRCSWCGSGTGQVGGQPGHVANVWTFPRGTLFKDSWRPQEGDLVRVDEGAEIRLQCGGEFYSRAPAHLVAKLQYVTKLTVSWRRADGAGLYVRPGEVCPTPTLVELLAQAHDREERA
jgi:hypothetical protein